MGWTLPLANAVFALGHEQTQPLAYRVANRGAMAVIEAWRTPLVFAYQWDL